VCVCVVAVAVVVCACWEGGGGKVTSKGAMAVAKGKADEAGRQAGRQPLKDRDVRAPAMYPHTCHHSATLEPHTLTIPNTCSPAWQEGGCGQHPGV
jgi:hypothetical protein